MKLVEGKKYVIQYRLSNQRKDRVFVGTYLGINSINDNYDFDLRPTAGTSQIPPEAICLSQETDLPHMQPVEMEAYLAKQIKNQK
jgi:hypothetical protein